MRLKGQRAIVTGCSRGLGALLAETMWSEGADLLMVARSEVALRQVRDRLRARQPLPQQQAHALSADLGATNGPETVLSEARRLWPRIDILVNNAAIGGPIGTIAENDWSAWRETIQINLLAPVALSRLCVGWMKETGGGRIVNLSGGGAAAPRPNFSAYATAKCALVRFSETVAAEVADFGIRVNCVAPGAMNTELLQEVLRAGPESVGAVEYAKVQKLVSSGGQDPKPAADLIVYLASRDSDGITGKLISAVWDPWDKLHQHVDDLRKTDIYTLRRIVPEDRGRAWANA